MLEFRVLGPLEVADGGRPTPLGSGRQMRLLSCLLLHPNEVVPRDLLIEALWGERAPKTADNALRVQVHTLRKLLGQKRIATDGPGYRLHVEPGELDLERFEELFTRGRSELASGEADEAAKTFREALDLWRGPALADVAYEAFAPERDRAARGDAARRARGSDRGRPRARPPPRARPRARGARPEHPLRERLHGQLMLALYRAGRQTAALAVFRAAAEGARRGAGARAGSRSQGARAGDPPPGRGVTGRARRAPRAPPPARRTDPARRSPARARARSAPSCAAAPASSR